MKTNELKKGDLVRLRNGWYAVIADNKKGNIRMAEVYGIETEIGSVYAHDIVTQLAETSGPTEDNPVVVRARAGSPKPFKDSACYVVRSIEHTPEQLKLKQQTEAF